MGEFPPPGRLPPPPAHDQPAGINHPPPPFIENGNLPFDDRLPPRRTGSLPAPKSLALLDANKAVIVGGMEATEEAIFKPLTLYNEVIGYIRFEPFNKITDELDKQFVQHQNQAFIKIALWALGIVLIGAGLFRESGWSHSARATSIRTKKRIPRPKSTG